MAAVPSSPPNTIACVLSLSTPSVLCGLLPLLTPVSRPTRSDHLLRIHGELNPPLATGLGLVSLAWAAGAILSVTLISQSFTVLSTLCSCISAILALSLCFLLPETHSLLLSDSLEDYSLHRRSISKDLARWGMLCDDVTEEVAKNTILNAINLAPDPLITRVQTKEETAHRRED